MENYLVWLVQVSTISNACIYRTLIRIQNKHGERKKRSCQMLLRWKFSNHHQTEEEKKIREKNSWSEKCEEEMNEKLLFLLSTFCLVSLLRELCCSLFASSSTHFLYHETTTTLGAFLSFLSSWRGTLIIQLAKIDLAKSNSNNI